MLAVAGLFAEEDPAANTTPPSKDDKGYWNRVTNGTIKLRIQPRLKIVSRGKIVLHGTSSPEVSFKIKQAVRARTEDEARTMMGGIFTGVSTYGDWTTFVVTPNASPSVATELDINVPRQMLAAIIETQYGGPVEAYDFDGNVQAITRAGVVHLDRIKGDVIGRTGGGEIHIGKIGGSVRCMSGAGSIYLASSGKDAQCATAGGDITVGDSGGALTLSTEGGNIRVTKAATTVDAHSAAGLIEVAQAGGAVTADTSGGSIQVDSAHGVRAESAMGMVRVRAASGPMNVAAAAGSILAQLLAGGRLEDSSLVAGNGDITVMIPSNLAVTVAARTDTGGPVRIISDFPEIRVNSAALFQAPLLAQGAINGGGPVLRLNTGRGVIYLRRMK
jgi:hypothetical protein